MRRAIFILSRKADRENRRFPEPCLTICVLAGGWPCRLRRRRTGRPVAATLRPARFPGPAGCVPGLDHRVGSFDLRDPGQRGEVLDALDVAAPVLPFDFPAGCLGDLGRVIGGGRGCRRCWMPTKPKGCASPWSWWCPTSRPDPQRAGRPGRLWRPGGVCGREELLYGKPEDFLLRRLHRGRRSVLRRPGPGVPGPPRRRGAGHAGPAGPGHVLCDLYSLGFTEAENWALKRSERAAIALFMQEFGRPQIASRPFSATPRPAPTAGWTRRASTKKARGTVWFPGLFMPGVWACVSWKRRSLCKKCYFFMLLACFCTGVGFAATALGKRPGEQVGDGGDAGFGGEARAGAGEMGLGDDRGGHRLPGTAFPGEPAVFLLAEDVKRLVADLGEFRAPSPCRSPCRPRG